MDTLVVTGLTLATALLGSLYWNLLVRPNWILRMVSSDAALEPLSVDQQRVLVWTAGVAFLLFSFVSGLLLVLLRGSGLI